jgi:hypothetical protein
MEERLKVSFSRDILAQSESPLKTTHFGSNRLL